MSKVYQGNNPPNVFEVRNQAGLEEWDEYVNYLPPRQAVILPLDIDLRKGRLFRARMSKSAFEKFYAEFGSDIPEFLRATQGTFPTMTNFPNIDEVVTDYLKGLPFKDDDDQSDIPITPLDVITNRPTYFLFRIAKADKLKPESKFLKWRFSKDKQITIHNDGLGPFRNVLPICTLDNDEYGGKALLVYNRHRCNPPTMKYDLHITIHQKGLDANSNWVDAKTPIIIDPGFGNNGTRVP